MQSDIVRLTSAPFAVEMNIVSKNVFLVIVRFHLPILPKCSLTCCFDDDGDGETTISSSQVSCRPSVGKDFQISEGD